MLSEDKGRGTLGLCFILSTGLNTRNFGNTS